MRRVPAALLLVIAAIAVVAAYVAMQSTPPLLRPGDAEPAVEAANAGSPRAASAADPAARRAGPTEAREPVAAEANGVASAPPPREPGFVWIEVRDERERAVPAVPVAVRTATDAIVWRGVSGPAGRVRAPDPTARGEAAWAMVAIPLPMRVEAELERAAAAPVVVLHLPPVGSVEVAILGDVEMGAGAVVRLRAVHDGVVADRMRELTAEVANGRARFAHVGLGLRLEAEGARVSQAEPGRCVFAGPRAPRELVFAQLSLLPRDAVVLVVRVTDERGQPFRAVPLEYTIDAEAGGGSSRHDGSITNGDDGVVRLLLADRLGDDARRTLTLRLAEPDGDVRSGGAPLPTPLHTGENDLGTLVLDRAPLVASGLVHDDRGEPIEGAMVQAELPGARAEEPWHAVRNLRATTAANGAFVLRGVAPTGPLRLRASADGHLPAQTAALPPPVTSCEIALPRSAALLGGVVPSEALAPNDVLVELRLGAEVYHARVDVGDQRWSFRFASLPVGIAELGERSLGDGAGEQRFAGIELRAGEIATDPRVQAIDLATGLRSVPFAVVDVLGAPLRDVMVFVLDGDEQQQRFEGLLLADGRGCLRTHASAPEVLLGAPGHRWLRVALAERAAIALPALIEVAFVLAADVRLAAGETLAVELTPQEPLLGQTGSYVLWVDRSSRRSGSGRLPWQVPVRANAADGRAVVALPRAGRHRVRWVLRDARGEAAVGAERDIAVSDLATVALDAGVANSDLERARARR